MFTLGQRVVSDKFGNGTVLTVSGSRVLVQFDGFTVKLSENASALRAESDATGAAPKAPEPATPLAAALAIPAWHRPRMAIDALRFGVVPSGAISDVTLDFAEWQTWIHSRLPSQARPTFTEIAGAFGSGKSHSMAVVRQVALAAGYVIANVEVDGGNLSFARPEALAFELFRSMRGPGEESATFALDLFVGALARETKEGRTALSLFDALWANYQTVAMLKRHDALEHAAEELNLLLSGDNARTAAQLRGELRTELRQRGLAGADLALVSPQRLIATQVVNRPPSFANALMGYAELSRQAGFKGLVITFDEFEVQEALLSGTEWSRLSDVLAALANAMVQGKAPLAVFVATVEGAEGLGDMIVARLRDVLSGEKKDLPTFSNRHLADLAARIAALYSSSYELHAPDVARLAKQYPVPTPAEAQLLGGSTRAHVRRLIAHLDSVLGPPAQQ